MIVMMVLFLIDVGFNSSWCHNVIGNHIFVLKHFLNIVYSFYLSQVFFLLQLLWIYVFLPANSDTA